MLEAFVTGFFNIFTWPAFGVMLIGIAVGFVVGILPGLGGAVTLALMLPFVFQMSPIEAFAFLLGMHAVTATTGDITSVLFAVPGEATSAAVITDGHPMAKRGEAGRALGAALMSSLVGAVVGAFALALAVPIVRPLVLSFGAPEFFMLTLLGMAFVVALSGGALVKGLIAAGLGLLLATVGVDPHGGIPRFTFDSLHFWDGVGLVPVTVGLFAIPEVVDLAVRGTSIADKNLGRIGGVLEGIKDTFRHWGVTLRCSLLGTFIGIIPGLGGGVAQWVAYAHAVQSARDKSGFGQGDVRGVLGPGAANNSKEGGALIPTIAFGVPGSVAMAILLGAFLIQGLVPGPAMLTRHLDLTFSMMWIIVVSNVITVAVCLLFLNQLVRITYIRGGILIPFILLLVFLGGYTAKNSFIDVVVVCAFGVLGWIMVQLRWPRPPLILGLVLGGLAENYLFRSIQRYDFEWLGRPLVLVFALLIVGILFWPILEARLPGNHKRKVPDVAEEA